MRTDRRTDITKPTVAFRNFLNAPKSERQKLDFDRSGNTRCKEYDEEGSRKRQENA